MTTRERILKEALILFSEKGYSDVYVEEIARAVGIRAPSLYKHFKGKQAIFDSCVEEFYGRMTHIRNELLLPGTPGSEVSYKTADMDQITEFTVGLFMFFLKDEMASGIRKMLLTGRYREPKLNQMYEELFITGVVDYETAVFAELIKAGVIRNEDPHLIALRFYTPVYFLLQKYDMQPGKDEEAKKELISMVREFCVTYRGDRAVENDKELKV